MQKGKTIPLRPAEVWNLTDSIMRELEKSFGPFRGPPPINILILLGEVLTVYFHEAVLRCHTGKKPSFISGKILPTLAAWKASGVKKPLPA